MAIAKENGSVKQQASIYLDILKIHPYLLPPPSWERDLKPLLPPPDFFCFDFH